MAGWLAGWLASWLVGWLAHRLDNWLVSRSAVSYLVVELIGQFKTHLSIFVSCLFTIISPVNVLNCLFIYLTLKILHTLTQARRYQETSKRMCCS